MKEPVRRLKRPWLVYVCVAAIAVVYFGLLAKNRHPEPGANLRYDVSDYRQVDTVETRFVETGRIKLAVEDARAMTVLAAGGLMVGGKNVVALYDEGGREVSRFSIKGTPTSITQAPGGEVLIALRDHVATFDLHGTMKKTWDSLGERAYLTSMAADEENVYVADAGNRVVYRFDRSGRLLNRIGEADPARDIRGLVVPSPYFDVALDGEGMLWVVNPGELGLENYRPNGDLITSWYKPSMKLEGFCGCCNPSHIAFTPAGSLVTCEKGLVRVKIYDVTSGEFQELVAGSELFPKEQAVRDLAVDTRGRILVLDPRHDAVRIFEVKEKTDG